MRTYSTEEAAQLIGVHPVTVRHWLAAKKFRPSIAVPMGGDRTLWRWTDADVRRARKYKGTTRPGPKPAHK